MDLKSTGDEQAKLMMENAKELVNNVCLNRISQSETHIVYSMYLKNRLTFGNAATVITKSQGDKTY